MKAILTRQQYSDKQVLGEFSLFDGDKEVFTCKTLELPWKNNESRVSCIPTGNYKATLRDFGGWANESFHITTPEGDEVPGRSAILIHKGNFFVDILGCILLGKAHADLELKTSRRHIKRDGYLDVTASGATVKELLAITSAFDLEIQGTQPDITEVPSLGGNENDEEEKAVAKAFAPFSAGEKASVTATTLNIRETPNGAKVIEEGLPFDTVLDILEEVKDGWIKVKVSHVEGWVSAKFVEMAGSIGFIATQKDPLNVRSEPNGEVMNKLPKGTQVEISEESEGWLKIKTAPTEGYVFAEYTTKFIDE